MSKRESGAYYTGDATIYKVIQPLFLDTLHEKFEQAKDNKDTLQYLHDKIASLTFFDPACGTGNFLIATYLALQELEAQIIAITDDPKKVNPRQFYGIDIEPSAVEQCFHRFKEIDDSDTPNLFKANALRVNWEDFLKPSECSYIVGNPPFRGFHYQTKEQKEDMKLVFKGIKATGILDYCSCWFLKAAQYIQANPKIEVAFISTNSIYQGTQVATLWQPMIEQYKVSINFAHRNFVWKGEGKNDAKVICSISSFSLTERKNKRIWDYTDAA